MADVTISGSINDALTTDTLKGGSTEYGIQGGHSITNDSFITFSGNEDLGNGLKANFKLEQALDLNNHNSSGLLNANSTGNNIREAWVGISSDVGTLNIGNQYTPMFLATIGGDPLGANNVTGAMGDLASFGAILGNNSITYTSPTINGITFSAMQNYGSNESVANNAGNAYGWSLAYANGPLSLAYGRHEATLSGADSYTLMNIGAGGLLGNIGGSTSGNALTHSYTDGATISIQGGNVSYDFGAAKVSYFASRADISTSYIQGQSVGISIPVMSNVVVNYSGGTASAYDGTDTYDYSGYQYSVQYNFSKRTNLYVAGGQIKDNTNGETRQTYGFGIAHTF